MKEKRRPKPLQKLKTKIGQKITFVQPFDLFFLSGRKLTAREINMITSSNDARKVISELRRSGWNITDLRLSYGCKLYWINSLPQQKNLNFQEDQA